MYIFFPQLLNSERCDLLNKVALEYFETNRMNLEKDGWMYDNSYGFGSIPEYEQLLDELTPLIKEKTGFENIKRENSYTRIYYNGAKLEKHKDREGLDLTLTICTYSNIKKPWPLYVEVESGDVKSFETKPGDGALIMGTAMNHWRDPLVCGENEMVIQSFYHWRILNAYKIF